MDTFIPVYDKILQRYGDLSLAAVYGLIASLSRRRDERRISYSYLARRLGLGRTIIHQKVKFLIKEGLIVDETPNLMFKSHVLRPSSSSKT